MCLDDTLKVQGRLLRTHHQIQKTLLALTVRLYMTVETLTAQTVLCRLVGSFPQAKQPCGLQQWSYLYMNQIKHQHPWLLA
jgi:hypothetical protein